MGRLVPASSTMMRRLCATLRPIILSGDITTKADLTASSVRLRTSRTRYADYNLKLCPHRTARARWNYVGPYMTPMRKTTGLAEHKSARWAAYWKHLRVPFQLSLSPLFLWGFLLANGRPSARLLLGYVAFHLFLYTGITAFNSAYDRDEGPVGGMYAPPPPPSRLLEVSLGIQIIGAILCLFVNFAFFLIYLTIALLAAGYSHPRIRWKAHPIASVLTVFIGQGALGFLAGWSVTSPIHAVMTARGIGGMLSAAFTTLGLYPLTQIYQLHEDATRGDRTLAIALGPERALLFSFGCLMIAGLTAAGVMVLTGTPMDAVLVSTGYLGMLLELARFIRKFRAGTTQVSAFRFSLRLNYVAAAGFLLFMAIHFANLH